ncbi:hypothetical protein TNCV_4799061 [Trichonephila clavipes]|nr:hypothetical protein TNCV_4799061 [Trichonephila clavipes]
MVTHVPESVNDECLLCGQTEAMNPKFPRESILQKRKSFYISDNPESNDFYISRPLRNDKSLHERALEEISLGFLLFERINKEIFLTVGARLVANSSMQQKWNWSTKTCIVLLRNRSID